MRSEHASSVRAGIFVIVCGAVAILVILALGHRSQLFVPRRTYHTTFHNASGLLPGADVRLAGVNAGTVRKVDVVAVPGEKPAVRVVFDVNAKYALLIRRDSRASIRTLGPLGDKYVEITIGSFGQQEIPEGGYIQSEETVGFYEIAEQARDALMHVNSIARDVADTLAQIDRTQLIEDASAGMRSLRGILEGVHKGLGLVNRLLCDPNLLKFVDDLERSATELRNLIEDVRAGRGGLGELLYGERFRTAVSDLADSLSSLRGILEQIREGEGAAHAVIYDPKTRKVVRDLGEAARRLNEVIADVQEARGTLGLLIADPTIWESLKRLLVSAEEGRTLKYLIRRSVKSRAKQKKDGR